ARVAAVRGDLCALDVSDDRPAQPRRRGALCRREAPAMRNVLALALVLMSAAAAEAAPCPVTIVRAPDDVREVVEQAVRAEPACTTALALRVVPTAGGLYVLARDEHGRVRERVVPHAQAAGVLVASWVADDAAATPPAPGPLAAPVIAGQAVAAVA